MHKNVIIADLSHLVQICEKNWWDINRFPTADITELELHFRAWAGLSELQGGNYLFLALRFKSPRWLSVSPDCHLADTAQQHFRLSS